MTNLNEFRLLRKLISKGDHIDVIKGQLNITPFSGSNVPIDWLNYHETGLIRDIVELLNIDAYHYKSYTVGRYDVKTNSGSKLCGGLTLQFENILNNNEAHAIFNVELTRERNTKHGKAGDDLPKGQFRVNESYGFYKLWLRTGLIKPARKSAFHDCMGKLKSLFFTGEINHKSKFSNKALNTLNVSSNTIQTALTTLLPDKPLTTSLQLPDNFPTIIPDKETASGHINNSIGENTSTYVNKCELSLQGSTLTSSQLPYHLAVQREIHEMPNDEWLKGLD